jgi:tryptophanyl-tRNA synthetase
VIVPGCTSAGIGCLDCKQVLLKHALPVLGPVSARRATLSENPDAVRAILEDGTARAQQVARQTLAEVKSAMQI